MHRRLLSVLLGLAGLVLALVAPDSAWAERRVALVVGNAAYQNAAGLSNTVNDATAMTNLFVKAGFDVVESRSDLGV
ncbi:MAG: caspase family protein, partial [Rhodoplanes sp.]